MGLSGLYGGEDIKQFGMISYITFQITLSFDTSLTDNSHVTDIREALWLV